MNTRVISHTNTKKNLGPLVVIIIVIVLGIYGSLDEKSIVVNNEGLTSFNSGNSQIAINQFERATEHAVTNQTKINVLKNLGYVHATEGQYDEALSVFKQALALTKENSFNYYLISGEVALLEYKPNAALLSFNEAYDLRPADFQVNNSLALFYLDLEEIAPQHSDYVKALSHAKIAYENDIEKSETIKQNLAIAHLFNEDFSQTISLLLTTDLDQHPYAAYWLGLAYTIQENEEKAGFYFQKAVDAGIEIESEVYNHSY